MKFGLIIQLGAWWIGAHYSKHDMRWCINVVPCVTLWVALPGGRGPKSASLITWSGNLKPSRLPNIEYPFIRYQRKA